MSIHPYRTHTCGELNTEQEGEIIRLSGWVHRKRDHGNLLFIDLRDHYGITQCVIDSSNPLFKLAESARLESVMTITGTVVRRTSDTINNDIPTGQIEVKISGIHIESACEHLPLPVNSDAPYPEDIRLRYRFLDLRREKMQKNLILRSKVISSIRKRMINQGFLEIQTPILTASSPEGARDFLVPSRLHPGKFYALPQAPQQFKQLLMISGIDKYFQIAPCFRDEDARADRSPGEFYQLDFEMAFVTQEDVFDALEPVLYGIFTEFGNGKTVNSYPFPRIPYDTALLKYGTDKPDLRNPITISDVTDIFRDSDFSIFAKQIEKGAVVRGIPAFQSAQQPRSFFDKLNRWARDEGAAGLGYVIFEGGEAKGPIAKHLSPERIESLRHATGSFDGDSIFLVCDMEQNASRFAGQVRTKLGEELDLIDQDTFQFCWIVDYPMFEMDEKSGKIQFIHNPFSMPQGGLMALENHDPLNIKAYQYDIVCNGVELSSGAIRNHNPAIMYKAFEIAGYTKEEVDKEFSGMISAFQYGAPPHGGSAPGIDRMIMLLADEPNIREVIAFPMNQQAEDLLMGAPSTVQDSQLKDLHLKVHLPPKLETNKRQEGEEATGKKPEEASR